MYFLLVYFQLNVYESKKATQTFSVCACVQHLPVTQALPFLGASSFKKLAEPPECSQDRGPGCREGFSQESIISESPEPQRETRCLGKITKIAGFFHPSCSEGKKPNLNSSDSDPFIHLKGKVHKRICGKSPSSAVRPGFESQHYRLPAVSPQTSPFPFQS